MNEKEFTRINPNADERMLDRYYDIVSKVKKIKAKKIIKMKNEKNKNKAIGILQDIHTYLNKQLVELNEIEIIDIDFKEGLNG